MIAAIILAKGDSNRIPRKNMKLFCNEPLVYWSIEQAMNSKFIDEVYVSTDSVEIEQVALTVGAKVIKRPYELTLTSGAAPTLHAINQLEKEGKILDAVVSLLPTSPARLPKDIDGMVSLYLTSRAESTAACCEQLETVVYEKLPNGKFILRMFAKHHEYYVDGGGMSVFSPDWFIAKNADLPEMDIELDEKTKSGEIPPEEMTMFPLKEWQMVELDLPEHWAITECAMQKYILGPLGRDCYKRYKEQEHGTKDKHPGDFQGRNTKVPPDMDAVYS